jgi:hypothetical protein
MPVLAAQARPNPAKYPQVVDAWLVSHGWHLVVWLNVVEAQTTMFEQSRAD